MTQQSDKLRNIALVAHVDHGKTTLVDALLRSTGTFAAHAAVIERVMDNDDQERERGITILAKAAQIEWKGTKINLVDTPGHADFGGEVERALALFDGILLLVDAAEGPLPQTRYVLSKALALDLPVILVINKVDRQDERKEEVLLEVEQLFLDLAHADHHLSFPVYSAVARESRAMEGLGMPAPDSDLSPLLDAIVEHIPAPTNDPTAPLQAMVTNLDASDYLGRLAIGRVISGVLRKGDNVAVCQKPTDTNPAPILKRKLSSLFQFSGIERSDATEIVAGDLFILSGIEEVEVGDTIASVDNPVVLPRLEVDEPVLRMSFGVNTSPYAGRDGKYLTSRHLRDRLNKEILGNVSIKISNTEVAEVMEVAGRGELQLAVLIENMRREGFELQVSRPEVITKDIDGKRHEPLESGTCDVPEEYVGAITQALAPRKGRITDLRPGDPGRTIVSFEAPSRGLIGFRSLLLTVTRGTALLHQSLAGWMPWCGEHRLGGAMIADRMGTTTAYALDNLQLRGTLFVSPGDDTYEGMVVGENSRDDEMVVNAVRAKEKTNIRTHSHDDGPKLATPVTHTLETAIEWIGDDELVEVTPNFIRIRKRYLTLEERRKYTKKSNN